MSGDTNSVVASDESGDVQEDRLRAMFDVDPEIERRDLVLEIGAAVAAGWVGLTATEGGGLGGVLGAIVVFVALGYGFPRLSVAVPRVSTWWATRRYALHADREPETAREELAEGRPSGYHLGVAGVVLVVLVAALGGGGGVASTASAGSADLEVASSWTSDGCRLEVDVGPAEGERILVESGAFPMVFSHATTSSQPAPPGSEVRVSSVGEGVLFHGVVTSECGLLVFEGAEYAQGARTVARSEEVVG